MPRVMRGLPDEVKTMSSDKRCSRREFLVKPLLTAGAASLLARQGSSLWADPLPSAVIERTLGKTGIRLPIVSMGVMNADAPGLVRRAYEIGVRHLDTAASYGRGRNEELVGGVLKELGCRDKVTIGTKFRLPWGSVALSADETRQKLTETFEGSLKRLQTDYVDVLYIHGVSSAAELVQPGYQETLAKLREEKKARFVGVSTHSGQAEVLREVAQGGFFDVVLVSINVTMKDNQELLDAIKLAASKGVGLIAMKTQGGGRRRRGGDAQEAEAPARNQTAMLKWVLANEAITTAVPGVTTIEQLEELYPVGRDLKYTDEEKAYLGDPKLKADLGFCQQCRECLPHCPKGVDVPALMRAHMYEWQYGNRERAVETLVAAAATRPAIDACRDCARCVVRCAQRLDVARRIGELGRAALA